MVAAMSGYKAGDQPDGAFVAFFNDEWQRMLERVTIPGMDNPSWDRKAAWLLYKTMDEHGAHGFADKVLGQPVVGAFGGERDDRDIAIARNAAGRLTGPHIDKVIADMASTWAENASPARHRARRRYRPNTVGIPLLFDDSNYPLS